MIEDAVGDFEFAESWQSDFATVTEEQRYDIRVAIKSRAFLSDIICNNNVRVLAGEFSAGVFSNALRFGSETHDNAISFFAAQLGKNIPGRFEFKKEATIAAFHLLHLRPSGAIV